MALKKKKSYFQVEMSVLSHLTVFRSIRFKWGLWHFQRWQEFLTVTHHMRTRDGTRFEALALCKVRFNGDAVKY